MKTVYEAVRGEDWSRKMKKMAMLKNHSVCTVSNLHRQGILRSCGIYMRTAHIETTLQQKPEVTHIEQSKLTS